MTARASPAPHPSTSGCNRCQIVRPRRVSRPHSRRTKRHHAVPRACSHFRLWCVASDPVDRTLRLGMPGLGRKGRTRPRGHDRRVLTGWRQRCAADVRRCRSASPRTSSFPSRSRWVTNSPRNGQSGPRTGSATIMSMAWARFLGRSQNVAPNRNGESRSPSTGRRSANQVTDCRCQPARVEPDALLRLPVRPLDMLKLAAERAGLIQSMAGSFRSGSFGQAGGHLHHQIGDAPAELVDSAVGRDRISIALMGTSSRLSPRRSANPIARAAAIVMPRLHQVNPSARDSARATGIPTMTLAIRWTRCSGLVEAHLYDQEYRQRREHRPSAAGQRQRRYVRQHGRRCQPGRWWPRQVRVAAPRRASAARDARPRGPTPSCDGRGGPAMGLVRLTSRWSILPKALCSPLPHSGPEGRRSAGNGAARGRSARPGTPPASAAGSVRFGDRRTARAARARPSHHSGHSGLRKPCARHAVVRLYVYRLSHESPRLKARRPRARSVDSMRTQAAHLQPSQP